MIVATVGPEATYYRVLTPSWAFQPRSGAGAATKGGRFNRPGTHAVYLSAAPGTAIAEYGQAERLFSPGTLAGYRVTLARIVDFSGGYSPRWDALWRDWDCAWKDLWFRQRIEPPTWEMADLVLTSGAAGLAFPSTKQPSGENLVIYPDVLSVGDAFEVHDPEGLLPRDRASWHDQA
ncbi:RES family NAD+ phosphorylase [Coralloluteibacterium stylophorae]|uniref:RES family NAD+ phosphorylase n=1 Tax=Coralloluteibacterium stylophorae TaxID=1776034 RepID=A0A8J7VUE0_9GAMM|nr:RES family NAD+ phosphorylase [Coralloluteibacterium stylophorae]MBS7455723.1 RES family NAD+ phosphorylase [Coralloluteibacterium stylophorae]